MDTENSQTCNELSLTERLYRFWSALLIPPAAPTVLRSYASAAEGTDGSHRHGSLMWIVLDLLARTGWTEWHPMHPRCWRDKRWSPVHARSETPGLDVVLDDSNDLLAVRIAIGGVGAEVLMEVQAAAEAINRAARPLGFVYGLVVHIGPESERQGLEVLARASHMGVAVHSIGSLLEIATESNSRPTWDDTATGMLLPWLPEVPVDPLIDPGKWLP